jgi:hypothetical protein
MITAESMRVLRAANNKTNLAMTFIHSNPIDLFEELNSKLVKDGKAKFSLEYIDQSIRSSLSTAYLTRSGGTDFSLISALIQELGYFVKLQGNPESSLHCRTLEVYLEDEE